MRTLMRVSIPVEAGNAAAKAGTLGSTVDKIVADLKPEAAYFFADDDGNRTGSIVFDMKESSQIPAIAEPWFQAFNPTVSLRPVMNPQDLATAGPSIARPLNNTENKLQLGRPTRRPFCFPDSGHSRSITSQITSNRRRVRRANNLVHSTEVLGI